MFLSSPALEDYAAMKRGMLNRYEQIEKCMTPMDFQTLTQHIYDDCQKYYTRIDAGMVNAKRDYLLQAIDKRTTELFSIKWEYEYLYN